MPCRIPLWSLLLSLLYFLPTGAAAQVCISDYFHVRYTTPTVQNLQRVVLTGKNELLLAGEVMRPNSVLLDGWVTLLSPQGTPLWSRRYTSALYNYIRLVKAIPIGDEGYMVAGNIGNVDTTKVPPAILTQLGFVMRIDKQGNILWSRVFVKMLVGEKVVDIADMLAAPDGDFIIGVNYAAAANSSNIICRITKDGGIKWTLRLHAGSRGGGYAAPRLSWLKNGTIAVANYIRLYDIDSPGITSQEGYYAACIHYDAGLLEWERLYAWKGIPSNRERNFGPVVQITELPSGSLSFITSQADTAYFYFRKSTRVLNFLTDKTGSLLQVLSYKSPQPPIYASAAKSTGTNGHQVILLDNADAPALMEIDAAGSIVWQKSYPQTGRSQETKDLVATPYGFYFFSFTHDGGSTDPHLVKTDLQGVASCIEGPHTLSMSDVSGAFVQQPFNLDADVNPASLQGIVALNMVDYPFTGNTLCKISCCEDVIDTADAKELCNATTYTLPNNYIVNTSGTYPIVYTTNKGCDSIVYFPIHFPRSPVVDLGPDDCLKDKDSVVLTAPPGYIAYNWTGRTSPVNRFVVRQPGIYWVAVSNSCATVRDSVEILQECAFTISMPTAFTPNGDRQNDVFRVPPLVRNRLIKLTIYNRYGQVVFESSLNQTAWDGRFKGIAQPAGSYVYALVMESLNGQRMVQKGFFSLLR